jgi:hypothetical protein
MSTPDDPTKNAFDDLLDKGIEKGIEQVPEDSGFGRALRQAGWGGLIMAVLIGNVPVSALIAAVVKGKATLDAGAIEVYFTVFVLVAPWVAVVAIFSYLAEVKDKPQMSGYAWFLLFALAVCVAGFASVSLGGAVPATVPASGSPGGLADYTVSTLGEYLELFGPWPILAGCVEGGLFGYWAAQLQNSG